MNEFEELEKNFQTNSKTHLFLWLVCLCLFLASGALITGLWLSMKSGAAGISSASNQVISATEDPAYLSKLASDLSSNGFILFGSDTDATTKEQLSEFGQAAGKINYIECDPQAPASDAEQCLAKNITIYPTWVLGNQQFSGLKSLDELSALLAKSP